MNMISVHSLESFTFDEFPELEIGAVDNLWIFSGIFNLLQQLFCFNLLHRVSLSCSNVDSFIFLAQLKPFLIIGVDYLLDNLVVDLLVPFSFEISDDIINRDIASSINFKAKLDSFVSEDGGKSSGNFFVRIPFLLSIFLHLSFQFILLLNMKKYTKLKL